MNDLPACVDDFLSANDFSGHTVKAIKADLRKFINWFVNANGEHFDITRITVRDVADFREHLARVRRQSVATVNRALVTIRRFLGHLVKSGVVSSNAAEPVKELRRMPILPKGLKTSEVRKILREIELRQDYKAGACIGLMLHAGLRASEVVGLELDDVTVAPRSGQVVCRHSKGRKQRTIPLSVEARRVVQVYLETRPPSECQAVFIGERGALTYSGLRAICSKYAAITSVEFTAHRLRHTFAHRYLGQTNNDLVGLAQILGHESLNTTSIYTRRGQDELQARIDGLRYE
ncbi:MAG: tyrosine-type recombinase/integrase [Planctomycetes bacterium]|nr:tyrosine-type recombinase/integrase [Planctomycetota bacterium]